MVGAKKRSASSIAEDLNDTLRREIVEGTEGKANLKKILKNYNQKIYPLNLKL